MKTYVIRRRSNWNDASELEAAAAISTRVGNEEMPERVRWIRSYVVAEPDGRLGTVCIYQATGDEAIREHAQRVGISADEISTVMETVVIRDDPAESGAPAA